MTRAMIGCATPTILRPYPNGAAKYIILQILTKAVDNFLFRGFVFLFLPSQPFFSDYATILSRA
jgi:hypothetical protein